ncbi:MAG: DUF1415 domain-containing protein [Methylococcales bacterium]|nr:DUF1415 domain-containing protein [Methylococcales bacterium]
MTVEDIKQQTIAWLNSFIIKYNICPFAKFEHDKGSIYYSVIDSKHTEQCLEAVISECQRLDRQQEIATTLIIYPNNFIEFDDFLDFLAMAESLLIDQQYEGIYQLASFHPHYCFAGEDVMDPANYTNRSPYPMLHLIRESSLEQALKSYPHPENIPERNIQLMREMGLEKVKRILKDALLKTKEQ